MQGGRSCHGWAQIQWQGASEARYANCSEKGSFPIQRVTDSIAGDFAVVLLYVTQRAKSSTVIDFAAVLSYAIQRLRSSRAVDFAVVLLFAILTSKCSGLFDVQYLLGSQVFLLYATVHYMRLSLIAEGS